MKQAIEEGFILDVLKYYTPVNSYYKLIKKVEGDPGFDSKRALKKLRHYVESHDQAIQKKAEIMVDHFHGQVIALNRIGGQARAMVVTSSIERAVQYYHAIREYLVERKSPYKAIVAFSGEHEYGEEIPSQVAADPAYRNAQKNSDRQNARIEHDKAFARVMNAVLKDDTELFKQFADNESFRYWLSDTIFGMTYHGKAAG
jgi:type I site-specific restriction-modification system R (restriction) subunit